MSDPENSQTAALKSQASELIKLHVVLDGQDRPEFVYTARTETPNGGPCTRVQYVYKDASSTVVIKMKEINDTWNSSFDI